MMIMLVSSVIAPTAVEREEFTVDAGITPDSPFYFIDEFFERVGNDPEKAREYREEKLAELKAMAAEKNKDAAEKALTKAQEYGEILEKEVTPEMKDKVNKNAAAIEGVLEQAAEELPELKEEIKVKLEQEQRIAFAAEVSTKIKQLCETLAKLDPQQYAETCKTKEDSPAWQKKQDQQLTEEQQQQAAEFTVKMRRCMETEGKECDCEFGIQSFDEMCVQGKRCQQEVDSDACKAQLSDSFDFKSRLPDYLHPIMEGLMKEFASKMSQQMKTGDVTGMFPPACTEAGATTMQDCMQIMEKEGQFGRGMIKQGPPERIAEFGRDCHAVQDLAEKSRCFEDFYIQAQGKFNTETKYEYEYKDSEGKIKYKERMKQEFPGAEYEAEYEYEYEYEQDSEIDDQNNERDDSSEEEREEREEAEEIRYEQEAEIDGNAAGGAVADMDERREQYEKDMERYRKVKGREYESYSFPASSGGEMDARYADDYTGGSSGSSGSGGDSSGSGSGDR